MKYKLGRKDRITKLYPIIALRDIPVAHVKVGDRGGQVKSKHNLSQEGDCWISGDARVYGSAKVYESARISGNARVYGSAKVYESARISGNAKVYGNSHVFRSANVFESAQIFGSARISESAQISGIARISGSAQIFGSARISGSAQVYGSARVRESAWISGDSRISEPWHYLSIHNLKYPLTITPQNVVGGYSGCRTFTHEEFEGLTLEDCKSKDWTQKQLDVYKSFLGTWRAIQESMTQELINQPKQNKTK